MAMSFLQKIKLGLRGWNRRRAAEAVRKNDEFLARQTGWGKPTSAPVASVNAPGHGSGTAQIDMEGLQVAYLDDSGQLEHYLDRTSGEILEVPATDAMALVEMKSDEKRYRKIPRRSAESDASERRRFAGAQEEPGNRSALIAAADSPADFRKLLSTNRLLERAWYNFKNDEAMTAVEEWLKKD